MSHCIVPTFMRRRMGNLFQNLAHFVLKFMLKTDKQTLLESHELKHDTIEDVCDVFSHEQILPESIAREISTDSPLGPPGKSSGDTHDNLGLPALPEVMEIYRAYVNDELPTHLIYVPEKRLVSRQEVTKMFHHDILAVTEDDITKVIAEVAGHSLPTRQKAVKTLIRRKLKYAIFSHKWIERGEPTFHDIMLSARPAGYSKLMNFCERATKYDCHLAWSDTCCINKESNTEHEEAIRSMFKWYRNAHVCIAYLAEAASIDDFGKDAWFTRGWILQELLAPWAIKFYGKDWKPISNSVNDKQDLRMMDALSQATGISSRDLYHFSPGTRDVHTKMMWASKRTTSRVEDMAYCLMGIFDVKLTIAYGEGQRAFFRLMENIVNGCKEWEIMAWAGQASTDCAALPASPYCYKAFDETFITATSQDGGQWAWRGDRHFVMTKQGLQLRLLLVNLPSSSLKLFEGTMKDTECTRFGNCTVGIIDYWCLDPGVQGELRPGQDHLCWMLHSDPFSPCVGWKKVSTTELLFVRTDIEVKKELTMLWL